MPPWYLPKGTIYANDGQLEAGSSSCERWAIGCGTVVVIAVIAELVLAIVHPSYDSPWERWGSATADALIALGIVGEVLFGMWDGRIQTELRDRSNKKVADATARAAEAIERAAKADLARVKLEVKLAPRRLRKEQSEILVDKLSGGPPMYILCLAGQEAMLYFADFMFAMDRAGVLPIRTDTRCIAFDRPGALMGIHVHIPGATQDAIAHDPLVLALKAADIPISGVMLGPTLPRFAPSHWEQGRQILIIAEKPFIFSD